MKKILIAVGCVLALAGGAGAAKLATQSTVTATITVPYTIADQTGQVVVSKDIQVPTVTETVTVVSTTPAPPPAPAAPTNLVVASSSQTSISVSWNSVSGADSYRVYSAGNLVQETTSTSMTVGSLECGKSYDISVDAKSGSGTSSQTHITAPTSACDSPPPPPSSGFPDASNTGVPAGTTLTAYSGPSNISTPNTVIDGKTMGCISVSAPGVVIKNSKINCRNDYAVYVDDRNSTSTLLTIQDTEIDCGNTSGTAISEADFTARRVNIHGCENGLDVNQNVLIEDSYIHDLYNTGSSHTDGIQFGTGHWDGSGYSCKGGCVLNFTIRHNTIYGMGSDGSFGTSAIIDHSFGANTNILIDNNLLAGGAATLYCSIGFKGTNYKVTNNHFSTKFKSTVGFYFPTSDCADQDQSGNVIHETGQPLQLD